MPLVRWVPPHPRGWSLYPDRRAAQRNGSPAPAGMVPQTTDHAQARTRFPRTRGDGPCGRTPRSWRLRVPPHPRGWSPAVRQRPRRRDGSPAPAGMVPSVVWDFVIIRWFPRTRGDGPRSAVIRTARRRVPPHPRGWSPAPRAIPAGQPGSPAPAGMVPAHAGCHYRLDRFPRTRGDGPKLTVGNRNLTLVPPHPRGWSLRAIPATHPDGGSPAPAGMVPGAPPEGPGNGRFPRTRGDGPADSALADRASTVPPHPRGWSQS